MNYPSFLQILNEAHIKMRQIVDELIAEFPEYKEFFVKSYLVVTHENYQYEFKKELSAIDMARRKELIENSAIKDRLLEFSTLIEDAEKEKKRAPFKMQRKIDKKIAELMSKISLITLEDLAIKDNINVEVRFQSINITAIQAMKTHNLVNTEKTCQCTACIKVFLC